jgi:hypothetical protein
MVDINAVKLLLSISGPNEGSFTSRAGENEVWCLANITPPWFSGYLDELNWTVEDWPNNDEDPPVNSGDPEDPEPGKLVDFIVPVIPHSVQGHGGPLKYSVLATLNIEGSTIMEVDSAKQDNLDDLRQEYLTVRQYGGLPTTLWLDRDEFDQTQPDYTRLLDFEHDDICERHEWWVVADINGHAVDVDTTYAGDLRVTCGYRCPRGNVLAGSEARNSVHMEGRAFDFNQEDSHQNWMVLTVARDNHGASGYLRGSDGHNYWNEYATWPPPPGVEYTRGHAQW